MCFPSPRSLACRWKVRCGHWVVSSVTNPLLSHTKLLRLDAAGETDDKVKLQLSNGNTVKADHVLVAVGLQPNTELAEKVSS